LPEHGLGTLLARASDLMARYARAADAQDLTGTVELFAPDANLVFNDLDLTGQDEIRAWYDNAFDPETFTQHMVSNFVIEDAHDASVLFSCYLRCLTITPTVSRIVVGSYHVTARLEDEPRIERHLIRVDRVVGLASA